jgi:hypothetical protein
MSQATADFTIGSEVACIDGVCGELTRVVVDPVARALSFTKNQVRDLPPVDIAEPK